MATHTFSTPSSVNEPGLPRTPNPERIFNTEELLAILDAGPIDIDDLEFISRHRRDKALLSIQSLIGVLDEIDTDPDLEPDEDGEATAIETHGRAFFGLAADDCEPSLGAPEVEFTMRGIPGRFGHIDQRHWTDGGSVNDDGEPSLGWSALGDRFYIGRNEWSLGYDPQPEHDEVEAVSEDEGADIQAQPHDADPDEPSLGSLEQEIDQTAWATNASCLVGIDLELNTGDDEDCGRTLPRNDNEARAVTKHPIARRERIAVTEPAGAAADRAVEPLRARGVYIRNHWQTVGGASLKPNVRLMNAVVVS